MGHFGSRESVFGSLFGLPPLGRRFSRFTAETHLLREFRPRRRVCWRYHRIVRRQTPLRPVFLRGEVIVDIEVAAERLELLAVLQADDVIGKDGTLGVHGRYERRGGRNRRIA